MILPSARLLAWTAATAVPLAAVAGAVPHAALLVTALLTALVAVAAADALGSRRRLAGVVVELPALVRLTESRLGELPLVVDGAGLARLRLALRMPPEIVAEPGELVIDLPPAGGPGRVRLSLMPRSRGCYRLDRSHLEGDSRLGLWQLRRIAPVAAELRVYPNLMGDRQRVAALLLRRGGVGVHTQRWVGKGREIEQLRAYLPGDSFEDIHWRASAKHGHPVTKVHQIERTQEVYAVVDCSRLAARRRGETATLEGFLRAALVLALATRPFGDLFGLVTFSDRVRRFVRARSGKIHFDACRDALYAEQAQPVSPDFEELATFLCLRLRRRSLLVFLTDLDDPALAESFVRGAQMLRRQHVVLVAMMRPPVAAPLFSQPAADAEAVYERLAGHLVFHELEQLRQVLHRLGVSLAVLEQEALIAEVVSRYVAIKRRQLL